MFTEDQIKEIVLPIADCVQGKDIFKLMDLSYDPKFDRLLYKRSIPNPSPFYQEAIEQRNRVRIHACDDVFPFDILKSKAPNQTEEEWLYQQGIYENPTSAAWNLAVNKTNVISNPQNYSIQWPIEEQEKYFKEDYPDHHTLESWFFNIVRPDKVNYPNQVLLVRPHKIPWKNKEEYIVDQSVRINYVADIIDEYRKLDYKAGEYLVVLCEETVLIENNHVYQYDFYDKDSIWKIIPTGYQDGKYVYRFQFILRHDLGWLPARQLQGIQSKSEKGYTLQKSILSNSIPDLRKVIRLDSNLSISETTSMYPTRIRLVDRCLHKVNNIPCVQGIIWKDGQQEKCPNCKGTGMDPGITVGGEIRVKAYKEGSVAENNQLPMDPMKYVEPPTGALGHVDARIDKLLQKAFAHVNSSDEAKSNTATGVESQRHDFKSTAIQFSNEFFDLMEFTVYTAGSLTFKSEFDFPSFRKPTELDFKTAADITTEISEAKKAGMPETYTGKLLDQGDKLRFNTDPNANREYQFIKRCDRVYMKDDLTVTSLVATGRLSKLKAIVHDSMNTFLIRAQEDHENFWDKKYSEQEKIIFDYAQKELDDNNQKLGEATDVILRPKEGADAAEEELEDDGV